jgi:son of sevenless-like protein
VKVEELDPRVWKFEEPDTDDTVMLGGMDADGVQLVSGASLYKIIQRITFAQYPDPSFVTTFLLTYRLFLSPLEVLELLLLRFDTPPPPECDEAAFLKTTQLHIRLRVVNVLKQWLTHYFHDFRSEPALLDRLGRFIDDVLIPEALVTASEQLKLLIEKKQSENADKAQEKPFQFSTLPPTPILPVKLKRPLKLLDIHPLEVARQLTLIEHNLYRTITPCECLRQRWTGKDKATLAPNIIALIDRFNKVSRWCCSEIVREKDLKSRAVILNRFILIASQCRELNNFNGVMEIMAGLQNAAAYRLKKTWNLLPNKTWDIWEELTHLMSSEDNFRVFREALHKINPPCIPYLGVFLTDLTFIEDGNPDFLRPDLINITKLRYGARVIQDIKQYQQTPYCLEPVPFIQDWLMSRELYNEKDLYDHSLLCEERTRKK